MSVSSIFSAGSSPKSLAQLYVPASATASSTGTASAASSTSVSSQAQLLSQLQSLQTSNPAEFQKVTADISTPLQGLTAQSGTAVHGHRHGGGHHHGGGAPAAPADTSSDTLDTASDSVFNAVSLTGAAATTSSTLSSASSLAALAYQQFGGQGIGSVASSIIGQVLNTDLGTSAATGAVSLSA